LPPAASAQPTFLTIPLGGFIVTIDLEVKFEKLAAKGDASSFAVALERKVRDGCDRGEAMIALARRRPADHAAYVSRIQNQRDVQIEDLRASAKEYRRLVKAELEVLAPAIKAGQKTRADAFAAVTANHPSLHVAWLELSNWRPRR
jgi:hypothetical protein